MEVQQYWLILKRRWLPATAVFATVSALTFVSLAQQKNVYEAEGRLRFTRGDRTTDLAGVGRGISAFDPLVAENNPMSTEMEVIRSVPLIEGTITKLDLQDINGTPISRTQFLRRLRLTSTRGTDILQVGYRDNDQEKASRVVDTLMSIYLENHLRENRAQAVAARKFIEQQLPEAESRVQVADAELRRFKEANQVAALAEEERALVMGLEELRRRTTEAQSILADANAQAAAFGGQLKMDPEEAIAVTALSQSPGVQTVLRQLQDIESQLAVERVRFHDQHPTIKTLISRKTNLNMVLDERIQEVMEGQPINPNRNLQIGELRATLVADYVRAEVRRRGLGNQVATLSNAQAAYQARISTLPRLEQEQRELTRKLEAAQSTYSLLLQRFHEIRVVENQNVGNARVIQPAFVLERPVSPNRMSYLATGGIVALLLAVTTALVLEARDKSIKTVKEARDLFGFTLLGIIPFNKGGGKLGRRPGEADLPGSEVIVQRIPYSPISEAYRMLQANLKFLSSDRPLKTIVITSSVPSEGKSVVSANLAMARAQLGHRVLLVDGDMRCPRQHKIWDVLNDTGLSNVIVEQTDPKLVIKTAAPNLDLLTAGVTPPNPAALLDSQRMNHLIEQFSGSYDLVIIDTPALNTAADVPILGKMSDGLILVTRPGVVDAASAAFAKERLEQSGQHVLGQVINGVASENEPYSYYYYSQTADIEHSARSKVALFARN
jgi:capsular exopolysaccharide synthesis family protein